MLGATVAHRFVDEALDLQKALGVTQVLGKRSTTGRQAAAKDPLQGNFDTFFETSRGTGTFGAGVKRALNKSIGFRADAGTEFTKVPTFGLDECLRTSRGTAGMSGSWT